MLFSRYTSLNVVIIGDRMITPIVKLDGFVIENDYIFFDYGVVAFIIDENGSKYYINLSLSENKFIKLQNDKLFN